MEELEGKITGIQEAVAKNGKNYLKIFVSNQLLFFWKAEKIEYFMSKYKDGDDVVVRYTERNGFKTLEAIKSNAVEVSKDKAEDILSYIKSRKENIVDEMDIINKFGNVDNELQDLKKKGEIFSPRFGYVQLL